MSRIVVPAVALALLASAALATAVAAAVEIAVTVDDLPTHGPLPPSMTRQAVALRIVEALRRHAVPSVYGFVNGAQVRDDPDLEAILHLWLRAGFKLGNHTFSHLDLTRVSMDEYLADIERNEMWLRRLAPAAPKYFRYPYLHEGDTPDKRAATRGWLTRRGFAVAPVTISLDDWLWTDSYARCAAQGDATSMGRLQASFLDFARQRLATSTQLSAHLLGRPMRHVLLLHVGAFVALVLDDLLSAYERAGVRFITLADALADPAYTVDVWHVATDGRTFLAQMARTSAVPIAADLIEPPRLLSELCR